MKVENEKKIQRLEEEKTKIEQDLERFKYSGEAKLSRFPPDFSTHLLHLKSVQILVIVEFDF